MPPPARRPHELTLKNRKGRAAVNYRGRDWYFGPWDAAADAPTNEAAAAFRRQLAAWAMDPAAGAAASDDLVSTLCADWLESAASPEAGTRAKGQAWEAAAWLCRLHAATPVADFGPVEFAAWQAWLCRQVGPKSKRRYKRSSVLRVRAFVERCWRWGVEAGRVPGVRLTEFAAVSPPRRAECLPDERRRPVPAATVRATLARLNAAAAAAVRLAWWTGARVEEVAKLRASQVKLSGVIETPFDVRLDLGRFKGKVWAAVLVEHKSDRLHDRVLFFGPKAQIVLKPLLAAATPGGYLFRPAAAKLAQSAAQRALRHPASKGSLKPLQGDRAARKPGPHYSAGSLRKAVQRAAKAAGVASWYPRQLRQAFARRMISKGVTDADVACCLGHESRKGVTFRYTDKNLVAAAKVYAKYG